MVSPSITLGIPATSARAGVHTGFRQRLVERLLMANVLAIRPKNRIRYVGRSYRECRINRLSKSAQIA